VPFLTFKFFFAVLPLVILGYIFGTLVIAAMQGWHVSPLVILLNGAGILVAIWDLKVKLQSN
jgi:hypothetical protein